MIVKTILKADLIIQKTTVFISGLAIFLMMIIITLDVFLRTTLSLPIPGNYDVNEKYLLPLGVFPILYFTYKTLPSLDFISAKLHPTLGKIRMIVFLLVECLAFGVLTWATWNKAVEGTFEKIGFPAAGSILPLYPVLFLVPLGFGLLTLGLLLKTAAIFQPALRTEQQEEL